jgi:predicted dehydrogenase
MSRLVKVGVIGTGFIGPAHIEAARRTFLAEVIALADINEEVARCKAGQYAVPRCYGDYRNFFGMKRWKLSISVPPIISITRCPGTRY